MGVSGRPFVWFYFAVSMHSTASASRLWGDVFTIRHGNGKLGRRKLLMLGLSGIRPFMRDGIICKAIGVLEYTCMT